MYNKKDSQYFFLKEQECRHFIVIIFWLIICNVILEIENYIPFPDKLHNVMDGAGRWLTIFGVGAASILKFIFQNGKYDDKLHYINAENQLKKIERRNQKRKLIKMIMLHKVVVLTGESGSGKSVILSKLIKNAYYKENDYFLKWGEDICNRKDKVIILDQFERALPLPNLMENMQQILNSRKHIVIGIKKENLSDVLEMLGYNNKHVYIFRLYYDNTDKKQIESMCEEISGRNIEEFKGESFYEELTRKVNSSKIPIILVSVIWKIMKKENIQSMEKMWEECDYSFDKMASIYLENDMIGKLSYKDVAYPILYLLSRDSRCEYKCGINDFKNITFAENEKIEITLEQLVKIGLVKKVIGQESCRNSQSIKYEISHEFYAKKIMKICTKNITTEIRGNIENYQESYQKKRDDNTEIVVSDCYKNVFNSNKKKHANLMLAILCIILVIENFICWALQFGDIDSIIINNKISIFTTNNIILIFLNISIGLSIYYIYNYYCRFLIAFERKFIIVNIVGMIVSILSFAFSRQWAFFLGIEITFVGINMYFIANMARKSERNFFVKRMQTFCAIGVMTIILGISFDAYTKGNIILAWPLFILYIGYMLMGNLGHINQNYILMILGKIENEEQNEKN